MDSLALPGLPDLDRRMGVTGLLVLMLANTKLQLLYASLWGLLRQAIALKDVVITGSSSVKQSRCHGDGLMLQHVGARGCSSLCELIWHC